MISSRLNHFIHLFTAWDGGERAWGEKGRPGWGSPGACRITADYATKDCRLGANMGGLGVYKGHNLCRITRMAATTSGHQLWPTKNVWGRLMLARKKSAAFSEKRV